MKSVEPPRSWQDQQHKRILQLDAIAFAEICEVALPHLVSFLQSRFPQYDAHLHETVSIDCLLGFQSKPKQYDPHLLSLFAYLRMAVRRDMLNAVDKKQRRERRLLDIDDPNIQSHLPEQDGVEDTFKLDEWLQQHTDLSRQEIFQALEHELSPLDQQILLLMLDGVRETDQYVVIMGISNLDTASQRREVKRTKDRLTKKIRRFGKQVGKN